VRRRYGIYIGEDVGLCRVSDRLRPEGELTYMSQLAQNVGLLKLSADVLLRVLSLDLVEVDQLADQLFSRLNIVCEADGSFSSLAETAICDAVLAGK
jgi:hypothetical protein